MNSLIELKAFLAEQNLFASYTTLEYPAIFENFVTPEGMDNQMSFQTLPCQAKWWITYNSVADEFVFCVGYFQHTGEAMTKSEFVELLPNLPASKYTEENQLKWIKDGDKYTLQIPNTPAFKLPIITIVHK